MQMIIISTLDTLSPSCTEQMASPMVFHYEDDDNNDHDDNHNHDDNDDHDDHDDNDEMITLTTKMMVVIIFSQINEFKSIPQLPSSMIINLFNIDYLTHHLHHLYSMSSILPVAGFTVWKLFPETEFTHSLSMKIWTMMMIIDN